MNAQVMDIIVPPGVTGGQSLLVKAPSGQTMQVVVPNGYRAGMRFRVSIPNNPVIQPQQQYAVQSQYQANVQKQIAAQEQQRQALIQQQLAKQRMASQSQNTGATMKTAQIRIPAGVRTGDPLTVTLPNGTQVTIKIPAGTQPGGLLNVNYHDTKAPSAGPQTMPGTKKVKVVVPNGAVPGMKIRVSFEGYEFDVAVPQGLTPGSKFIAVLPTALAMQQRKMHARLEAEAALLKQQRDVLSAEKEKQAQAMIERSMKMQEEARRVFEQYDVNFDNAIDPAELLKLLQDSGFPKSVIEEELMNADSDGDHLISFDECT